MPEWEQTARQMLALFRMDAGPRLNEPRFSSLVTRIQRTSAEFRAWWPEQQVLMLREGNPHVFWYRRLGRIEMQRAILRIAAEPTLVLRVHLPPDGEETAKRLRAALSG